MQKAMISTVIMWQGTMNKSLQRCMDRPGWQLCLWQWFFLSLLGVIAYGGLLRPTWQQRSEAIAEVTKLQQYVEQQVSALAQLPSQALIRQQINTLLSENAWWQKPEILLAHQVGETIMPFGGQVIRWQRYSGSEEVVVENAIAFRRWEATLRVSFYGLYHLFGQLSEIRSPVLVKVISLIGDGNALTVKLILTEYLTDDLGDFDVQDK